MHPAADFSLKDTRLMETDIILPVGELIVSQEREAYEDESLRLVVPKLDLDCAVIDGTDLDKLEQGPGLYKFAQTPNLFNTNTSIAAHRDLAGMEFYYLDTLTEGDRVYLVYRNKVFVYLYQSTQIVTPDNWDPIRVYSDCRVTLTTCDPLGTSLNRMIVVAQLAAMDDYGPGYVFE